MRLTCVLLLPALLALSGCSRGGAEAAGGAPGGGAPGGATPGGEARDSTVAGLTGPAAAAAAFDARLVQLRQTDPAAFEREAATAVEGAGADVRVKFVALLRLAEYRRDAGSPRDAVPDFLRLIALDAKRAASSGALDEALAALTNAGLLLEADCIEWGPFRGRCAAALLADLYPTAPAAAGCAAVDNALFQCRVARAALEQLDAQATTDSYARFAESLPAALSGNGVSPSDALLLQACCAASAERLSRMFAGDFILFRAGGAKRLGSAGKAEDLMGRLCELSLDCLDALSDEPELTGEKYREILQQHVALLKNLNQREKVVACYTRYISRFVDSAQAAPVMLELADYYRDGWKTPAQAKDTYIKLCETYPGSAEEPVARMKEALCLYELGSFEDAYARIQEMVAAGVAPDPATAEFLLALTEAAMNMEEDAEARLIRLVNAFPAHETAPKSVFWIANSRFARQDYKGAKEMFAELVQRYPKSSYTKKAGDYVKRLDLLDAAK